MQHFPELQLTFGEARVLGCLLEKEALTPDNYPLTLNSLVAACNQTSSRHPVTAFTAGEVEEALRGLAEKYLVSKVLGSRVPKYEHCLPHVLHLQDSERAVLTVLLLRGQQTAGELKQRTERLHPFASLDEVEETLAWFIDYPHGPLVRRIPVGAGRRVETFAHLLAEDSSRIPATPGPAASGAGSDEEAWRQSIEAQIADLRSQIAALRRQVDRKDEPSRPIRLPEEY